jgi:hypothetical protein
MEVGNISGSCSSSCGGGGSGNGVQGMGAIPALGIADATVKARRAATARFNSFLADQHQLDDTWPSTMDDLTEAQANDRTLYERFAFWLTFTTESAGGEAFKLGTIKAYVRSAAQIMMQKYNVPGSNLSMLETSNNWMTKIVANMERVVMQRAFEDGTDMSSEAPALHLFHIEAIGAALSAVGTQDAAFRKLVILQCFMACGRCGEVSCLAWELINGTTLSVGLFFLGET